MDEEGQFRDACGRSMLAGRILSLAVEKSLHEKDLMPQAKNHYVLTPRKFQSGPKGLKGWQHGTPLTNCES